MIVVGDRISLSEGVCHQHQTQCKNAFSYANDQGKNRENYVGDKIQVSLSLRCPYHNFVTNIEFATIP